MRYGLFLGLFLTILDTLGYTGELWDPPYEGVSLLSLPPQGAQNWKVQNNYGAKEYFSIGAPQIYRADKLCREYSVEITRRSESLSEFPCYHHEDRLNHPPTISKFTFLKTVCPMDSNDFEITIFKLIAETCHSNKELKEFLRDQRIGWSTNKYSPGFKKSNPFLSLSQYQDRKYTSEEGKVKKFFAFFYDQGLLPHEVLRHLIQIADDFDFRQDMYVDCLISSFNDATRCQELSPNVYIAEVNKCLKNIKDEKKRQNVCADIVEKIFSKIEDPTLGFSPQQIKHFQHICKELGQNVQDPSVEKYKLVKEIEKSCIQKLNNPIQDFYEKYRPLLTFLLHTASTDLSDISKMRSARNEQIEIFLNNGRPGKPLPLSLENLTRSNESMVEVLNELRLAYEKSHILKEKNKNLKSQIDILQQNKKFLEENPKIYNLDFTQ